MMNQFFAYRFLFFTLAILSPVPSTAMICRQSLSLSDSVSGDPINSAADLSDFSSSETCRNDPVNNFDPMGLTDVSELKERTQLMDDLMDVDVSVARDVSKLGNALVTGTEVMAGINPIVGFADAISGKSQITGEALGVGGSALAVVSTLPGGALAKLFKPIKTWFRARKLAKIAESSAHNAVQFERLKDEFRAAMGKPQVIRVTSRQTTIA